MRCHVLRYLLQVSYHLDLLALAHLTHSGLIAEHEFLEITSERLGIERRDRYLGPLRNTADDILDRIVCFGTAHTHRDQHRADHTDIHICLTVNGSEPFRQSEEFVYLLTLLERNDQIRH